MRKLFAAIVVLAMLVSMFAVVSHAANSRFHIDGAYLTNEANPSESHAKDWVPNAEEKDVQTGAQAGDIGYVYGLGYSYFHIQGWWGDAEDFTDIGIQHNNGEIVWGYLKPDPGLAANAGLNYCARYNVTLPLQEGTVELKFYKKAAGGETVIATIKYVNEKSEGIVFEEKSVSGNSTVPGESVWLNEDGEFAAVKFTTNGEIGGVSISYWASNGTNGPLGSFRAELFAFDTDNDTTLGDNKQPVASTVVDWQDNNKPAFKWKLDKALKKGTYILRFTIFGDDATGVSQETAYVVFPAVNGEVDENKFEYFGTSDRKFNFAIHGSRDIADFYGVNPADGTPSGDGDDPVTPAPATGDNTMVIFALVAVLALAATLFIKKKSF
ncbi:MAG: LPXTG cell wall anchor domain-containing protein [Clostridia bacterium]|nr:LPXTG cell wall anchor domain-containing protein [Clostridia bacterium]